MEPHDFSSNDNDPIIKAIIEAAKKAKDATNRIGPARDYMDIGKKMGLSSTFGMELGAAQRQAYEEWKERHKEDIYDKGKT